jgi:hypothetical protein
MCLGELMSRRDAVATAFIVVGIILVAVGGSKESTCFTIEELVVRALFTYTIASRHRMRLVHPIHIDC